MDTSHIYAFDLSLRSTGIAHLNSGRLALRTSKTDKQDTDLQDAVRKQSVEVLHTFKLGVPDVVIIESGALGAIRGKGYEELGALRWLVRDYVRHVYEFDVVEISPSHLKKVITGNGRAGKKDVVASMTKLAAEQEFWVPPRNDDEADASALIYTYLYDNGKL